MAIVCGTDFSDDSSLAEQAAGHVALALDETLHLVHAVDVGGGERFDEPRGALITWAGRHLARSADRLTALGCRVETHVEDGAPDEVLVRVARETDARLVVVSAVSHRRGRDELGSHSDRIARRGDVAVLVVRDPAPFARWAGRPAAGAEALPPGEPAGRPLRILLAVDLTVSSEGAIDFAAELRRAAPCEVVAAHIYWPPGEYRRLGLRGPRSLVEPDPEVMKALERDLRARLDARVAPDSVFSRRLLQPAENAASVDPSGLPRLAAQGMGGASAESVALRIEPHLGRVADALVGIALEERADLVVMGAHRRSALARLWEGSVSRAVMHDGRLSVACVPAPREALARAAPTLRVVVAATDLSPLGDAAAGLAYAAVEPGGTVHLVHVEPKGGEPAEARRHLLGLVPADASARGVTTEIHVLEHRQPAEAICQAAERLGADAVCLATHGRTGLSRALLGSVAEKVVAGTRRSVLLARPSAE
ncbi:MAG TPA: universal stress protein [Kofleriaceae bacterium]|nr:universal stress protein [Kofleriaceae bacterium]